jgi:amidase
VGDVAAVLSAIAGPDDRDEATAAAEKRAEKDYTKFLDKDGLRGARVGISRSQWPGAGSLTAGVYQAALDAMRDGGAVLVEVPALGNVGKLGDASYQVMLYEFKAGLNAYFAGLDGQRVKIRSLADVIAFNEKNRETELKWFGQEIMLRAQEKGPLTDQAYLDLVAKCRQLSRVEGIDAVMDEHKLDVLVGPSGGPAGVTDLVYGDRGVGGSSGPAAVAGYPNMTVPAGEVKGLPVGLSFFGRAWSEPVIFRIAYAFEEVTKFRRTPGYLKTFGEG